MTPFSAPGATPPSAQGAPTPAGAPRRMPYGNLADAVRVAPPRAQAPPTTAPGIPIGARPRVPMAPNAGAPRPMVAGPMAAATPMMPRMQAPPPQPGRAPGIPPNAGAPRPMVAVPSAMLHVPLFQPTQRTPAPSLGKREAPTMAPATQQAKRHAPMPRPPTGGGVPLPANPAAVGARAPAHAQTVVLPTAGNAPRPPPQLPVFGVHNDPSKGLMARVVDPKRRVARDIGPFDTVHLAMLAHDRVAVACAGRGVHASAGLNYEAAFYGVETTFLQRWEGDVCEAVESGEYEKTYAKFLRAGYKVALNVKPTDAGEGGGEKVSDDGDQEGAELIASCYDAELFWNTIEEFFLSRPVEIGAMALGKGGELLRNRFVEMHRNKSLCPVWRRNDRMEKMKTMALQMQRQQQIHMQQQQQQQYQIQTQQQQQQQVQMQPQQNQQQQIHMQQQHTQMQPQQSQQQQIQMQQQQNQQQQIQMQQRRQQQFQQHQIQKQRQQQMMMAQQQQQYPDDDATLQVKQEM